MNVEHKVSFAPGRDPVSILIIPVGDSPLGMFYVEDVPQETLQALAPEGQLWGDDESRAVAQSALDAKYPAWGFVVVIPPPAAPPAQQEEQGL
jgi:hypothetical protein